MANGLRGVKIGVRCVVKRVNWLKVALPLLLGAVACCALLPCGIWCWLFFGCYCNAIMVALFRLLLFSLSGASGFIFIIPS